MNEDQPERRPFDRAAAGREAVERRWAPYRAARQSQGLAPTKLAEKRQRGVAQMEARIAKARARLEALEEELRRLQEEAS